MSLQYASTILGGEAEKDAQCPYGSIMPCWFFLIATLTVAGVPGCGQRNIQGDARNATAESQDRFSDSDGVRIRYAVTGSEGAEPIVFINGFPERLEVVVGDRRLRVIKGLPVNTVRPTRAWAKRQAARPERVRQGDGGGCRETP